MTDNATHPTAGPPLLARPAATAEPTQEAACPSWFSSSPSTPTESSHPESKEFGMTTMSEPSAPTDPAAQLRWLVDRAQISDLLVEFARSLDEKDWEGNTALYVPDGVFEAGASLRLEGHDQLRMSGSDRGLGQYAGTWHLSANHAIHIDGDTARTRSYLLGVHLLGGSPARHADGAGWYDCTVRRTPEGWRFVSVRISEVWTAGEELPHMARPIEA